MELLDQGGNVDMIPALAAIAWGSCLDSALLLLSYHLKDTPTFYMNLPWFLGVAKTQKTLGCTHMCCQEFLPKEMIPEQAEVLVILGES
jgi:hypothetical protein